MAVPEFTQYSPEHVSSRPSDQVGIIDESIRKSFLLLESLDRAALATLAPSLTTAQYHALAAIGRYPGLSLGELADRLLCAKSNASGIIDRLGTLGLVNRHRDTSDNRRLVLDLSEAGLAILERAREARGDALHRALAPASDDDLAAIAQALPRMTTLLEAAVQSAAEMSDRPIQGPASMAAQGKEAIHVR